MPLAGAGVPLETRHEEYAHIDNMEGGAFEPKKKGFGSKIKRAFQKMTHREETTESTVYGANGEKVTKTHTVENNY